MKLTQAICNDPDKSSMLFRDVSKKLSSPNGFRRSVGEVVQFVVECVSRGAELEVSDAEVHAVGPAVEKSSMPWSKSLGFDIAYSYLSEFRILASHAPSASATQARSDLPSQHSSSSTPAFASSQAHPNPLRPLKRLSGEENLRAEALLS